MLYKSLISNSLDEFDLVSYKKSFMWMIIAYFLLVMPLALFVFLKKMNKDVKKDDDNKEDEKEEWKFEIGKGWKIYIGSLFIIVATPFITYVLLNIIAYDIVSWIVYNLANYLNSGTQAQYVVGGVTVVIGLAILCVKGVSGGDDDKDDKSD